MQPPEFLDYIKKENIKRGRRNGKPRLVNYFNQIPQQKGMKMAYSKESSALVKSWMEESLKLEPGEELFIPCDNKSQQISLKTRLYGARKQYSDIDPIEAESITFSPVYRDGNPFIRIYKSKFKANLGFKKMPDGSIQEITVHADKNRTLRILKMLKENSDEKKIQEVMGKLSDEEKALIKEAKK